MTGNSPCWPFEPEPLSHAYKSGWFEYKLVEEDLLERSLFLENIAGVDLTALSSSSQFFKCVKRHSTPHGLGFRV
jgi:hypothetical protein